MSGGIEESFEMNSLLPLQKKNFWTIIYQGFRKNSVVACSMEGDPNVFLESNINTLFPCKDVTPLNLKLG